MRRPEPRLIVSCEHAGHRVPAAYRALFAGRDTLLRSHRGWDPGARPVALALARAFQVPCILATTTRLLVDVNRSPHNPAVFSEWTRGLPRAQRSELLARHHTPHWQRLRTLLDEADAPVLHVAVHSFTPVFRGERRRYRVGILHDPRRRGEREWAMAWQTRLRERLGRREVRRNAPYRGDADGLTTALRRELRPERYAGLELELNQAALARPGEQRALVASLIETLRAVLREGPGICHTRGSRSKGDTR